MRVETGGSVITRGSPALREYGSWNLVADFCYCTVSAGERVVCCCGKTVYFSGYQGMMSRSSCLRACVGFPERGKQVAELKAQEIKNSEMMVDELRELSNMAESKIMEVEAARRAEEVRSSAIFSSQAHPVVFLCVFVHEAIRLCPRS